MDAGDYDRAIAPYRLFPSQAKLVMVSHLPGSIQESPPCWKGTAHPQLPCFLPRVVLQRAMTLEPSCRCLAFSLWSKEKQRSFCLASDTSSPRSRLVVSQKLVSSSPMDQTREENWRESLETPTDE